MKAGCIANQPSEWEKITSEREILSKVSGLPLDLDCKSSVSIKVLLPHQSFLLQRKRCNECWFIRPPTQSSH